MAAHPRSDPPPRDGGGATSRAIRTAGIVLAVAILSGSPAAAHPPLDRALADVDGRLVAAPSDAGLLLVRAELRRVAGDLGGSLADLDAAAALAPDRPEIDLYRGHTLLDAGQPRAAREAFSHMLLRVGPEAIDGTTDRGLRAQALALRARAQERLGSPEAAAADLAASIDAAPAPSPDLFLDLARLYRIAGEPGESMAALERGLRRLGPVPSLVLAAARMDVVAGRPLSAVARVEALAALSPRRDRWLEARGDLLLAAGRPAEARDAFAAAWRSARDLPPWRRSTPSTRARLRRLGARLEGLGGLPRQGEGGGRPVSVSAGPLRPPPEPATPATRLRRSALGSGSGPRSLRSGVRERAAALVRGPYLQRLTPEAVVVRWRTDVATDTRLDLGPAPGALGTVFSDPAPTTEHVAEATALDAATTYYYAVGMSGGILAGDDGDHHFTTAPETGAMAPARVWIVGDSGTGDGRPAAVRDAYLDFAAGAAPDLWLMLGDNAYPQGTDAQYQSALFDLFPSILRRTALWPTIGNHDALSADSTTQSGVYFDLFTLPAAGEAGGLPSGTEAYYSFDWGPVHFVCLDSSDSDLSADGAMAQWLDADLGSTLQFWIVAFFHHPPYSKGSHDSDDPADSGGRLFAMREVFLPILESHGTDLVLAGHSHAYERSFLLAGHYGTSDTLAPSMILDPGDGDPAGDGAYLKGAGGGSGTVYSVAGSSGQVGGGTLNHPVMVTSLPSLGSMVVDEAAEELLGRFLDDTGAVRDTFVLRKDPSLVFHDGFETGTIDAWSAVVP